MKIVHVEDFVHPDAGYQLNSLAPLQRAQGHEVTIVTGELHKIPADLTVFFGRDDLSGRDARFERDTGVPLIRVPLLAFYSGRAIFAPSIFQTVSKLKPDVVFIHGEDTLTGMVFIRLSRWLRYPLVLDCHMVEMASLNRYRKAFRVFYQRLITPVILRENIPLIRVMDSDYVEKCLGIPLERTQFISFGTDTRLFSPDANVRSEMREKLGFSEGAFVVLYAGKLDETKGGRLLAQALRTKFELISGRKVEFLIIGNANGEYGQEVEAEFAASENRIIRLPTAKFRDLPDYYRLADLALFPKQCSMSFFDMQACGVPILFEENEINVQRCVNNNAFLFEPESVADLRQKIASLAATNTVKYQSFRTNSRQYIVENFDYVPIAQQFTDVLVRAVEQWRAKGRKGFQQK